MLQAIRSGWRGRSRSSYERLPLTLPRRRRRQAASKKFTRPDRISTTASAAGSGTSWETRRRESPAVPVARVAVRAPDRRRRVPLQAPLAGRGRSPRSNAYPSRVLVVGPSGEDEMVLAFLQAEVDSPRFSHSARKAV